MSQTAVPHSPETNPFISEQAQDELKLSTAIEGSVDEVEIRRATQEYLQGYCDFIFPEGLNEDETLSSLLQSETIVKERILSVAPLVVDIIKTVNERAAIQQSPEYQQLVQNEQNQWCPNERESRHLGCGFRCCVDAGIPREAVAGSVDPMGRSLAGDDKLKFSKGKGFRLTASSIKKKFLHSMRQEKDVMLEFLIEHTGCGRRGQMLANIDAENNGISAQMHLVFEHLEALEPEFAAGHDQVTTQLESAKQAWKSGQMAKDGGLWAGMFVKVAQAQAYRHLVHKDADATWMVPIKVYDKHSGNSYVGLDDLDVLMDPEVIAAGGLTEAVLEKLVAAGKMYSLRHSVEEDGVADLLQSHISVQKGAWTYENLQDNATWLSVKRDLIAMTGELWGMYDAKDASGAPDKTYAAFRLMIENYLDQALGRNVNEREALRSGERKVSLATVERRIIHQLFREFAYAWTLDTFEKGNMPGKHLEDHSAIGDSAILGATKHVPLGQGDLMQPSILEAVTGYSVLLHSQPGHKNEPVVAMLMFDTANPDANVPTDTYVNEAAISAIRMLLKQWPQLAIGDIVPVVLVVNKHDRSVNRIALSMLLAVTSLVDAGEENMLPDVARAVTSRGEVVLVPSELLLKAGIEAGDDLGRYRQLSTQIADAHNVKATQRLFHTRVSDTA